MASEHDAPRSSNEPASALQEDTRTSPQPYQYQSLPNESSIRLLELLPSPEGQIYVSLKIVNLDDDPVYDALSYSWANPITIREECIPPGEEGQKLKQSLLLTTPLPATSVPMINHLDHSALIYLASNDYLPYMDRECGRDRSQTILCDGKEMFVTKTLFEALTQLRRIIMSKKDANEQGMAYLESLPVSRSKYLWVDAVCINQEGIDEKNIQVPLMSRIYARAQYVFAWVGELDTLGADGFQAIIDKGLGQEAQDGPRARDTDDETFNKLDREVEKMQVEQRQLHALTALLSRQWPRRAWVVQEAVFAQRLYLWSGPLFLDWWLLVPTLQYIQEKGLEFKMANFTSSLICRESTAKLGKKLAGVEARQKGHNPPISPVTCKELLGNIKAAIKFVNGVIEMKKRLGMPCYLPNPIKRAQSAQSPAPRADAPASPSKGSKTPSSSKMQDKSQTPAKRKHSDDSNLSNRDYRATLESQFGTLSEPFAQGKQRVPDAGGARINVAFINHNFTATEPTSPRPTSLFSVLTRFRGVGASDPRDHVFAFLNLASQTKDLKADYRAKVQSVFLGTAKMILTTGDLSILSHIQDPSETKISGLPSWVPDFSVPLGKVPFVDKDGQSLYSACGNASQNLKWFITAEDDTTTYKILALGGYLIDVVAEVAQPHGCYLTRTAQIALKTPSFSTKPSIESFVRGRMFFRLGNFDPETQSAQFEELQAGKTPRVEMLWRTLIGDTCSNTYPAPVSAGFGFSDWVAAHIHHAEHFSSMMADHLDAVPPDQANEELKAFRRSQKVKMETWAALHKDELGTL